MIDAAVPSASAESLETVLRDELAHGEAVAETVVPILRHLLASDGNSVFTDEVLARVRGMLADIAGQFLDELAAIAGKDDRDRREDEAVSRLVDALIGHAGLLSHVHALALEALLTERLQARLSLDPVLSPLVQALIASSDDETSALAMTFLAAQARFCQAQRRMTLRITELPGDLLHGALEAMAATAQDDAEAADLARRAGAAIRIRYDEGQTRLGLASRLVTGMGGGAIAALSIAHAGVAIFLSALALGSEQGRDLAILSTNDAQVARLALSLRAAGLKPDGIAAQFLAIHPDIELPDGFERLGADRAAAILAMAGGYCGD